ASAFGRSESYLQVSWVFGGIVGLLIGGLWFSTSDSVYTIGFGVVSVFLALGVAQVIALRRGRSLVPRISLGALRRRRSGTPDPATLVQPTTRFPETERGSAPTTAVDPSTRATPTTRQRPV